MRCSPKGLRIAQAVPPMLITTATQISANDLERYSWTGLRRFHNVEVVQTLISDLHKVPRNDQNVKKQATQIRYCLQQAREYFDAAKIVSLATKPVLLYYSIMNLGLAEILLKQDGNSSLDRAREQHRHHGLTFEFASQGRQASALGDHARSLRAQPAIHPVNGLLERFGTFELWHRSCRPLPVVGMVKEFTSSNLSLSRFQALSTPPDERLPLLPEKGITLLECLTLLPGLGAFLYNYGIIQDVVRSKMTLLTLADQRRTCEIVIQPGNKGSIDEFLDNLKFKAGYADNIYMKQHIDSSGIVTLIDYNEPYHIPYSSALNTNEIYFWPRHVPLNEFGLLYVALYICGNYARYYPDFWIKDVETHAAVALAIEELIHLAEHRMALLALSELSRTYFVPEG
jgi:YaaC-like Protein